MTRTPMVIVYYGKLIQKNGQKHQKDQGNLTVSRDLEI